MTLACNLRDYFWTLFGKKGFNFEILQESVKCPNLTERLHSSFIGFDKTCKPSFRKRLESSSLTVALRAFVQLKFIPMSITVVFIKSKELLKCL